MLKATRANIKSGKVKLFNNDFCHENNNREDFGGYMNDNFESLELKGYHDSTSKISNYTITSKFIEDLTCLICDTEWESTSEAMTHVNNYHNDIISEQMH